MLSEATRQDLRNTTLYGSEISSTARISKMNMILTRDGHTNVRQHDSLANPATELYDIVISNIPFNLDVNPSSLYYTIGTHDGNTQCVEHIIKSLNTKPTARAVVIVSEGFLNNSESRNTRRLLIEKQLLKGLISLPVGVFRPYADAKTTILILQGMNGEAVNACFYYKVKNDGYTLTTRRRKVDGITDLDEFTYIFNNNRESLEYIKYSDIQADANYSLLYFKYQGSVPTGYIKLREIIQETNTRNTMGYPTATINKNDFYGVSRGEDYWGENFVSVTSKTNEKYKVLAKNCFAYNPSRVNIGSIGINISDNSFSVSSAYITFEVFNTDFMPEYIYLYLKSPEGLEEIITRCFGSARQALRFDDLIEISIPAIPIEEQKSICDRARNNYEQFVKARENLHNYWTSF